MSSTPSRKRCSRCCGSSGCSLACFAATSRQCFAYRPRSLFVRYGRIALGLLLVYLFFDMVVPALGRLELTSRTSWYDLGWYGVMPVRRYRSFDHSSPSLEFALRDARCSDENIIFAPRGLVVREPGGIILDHTGELIWRQGRVDGDTQDLRVQEYRGEKFLTFWVGEESDGQKKGVWYMMDETYTLRHQIRCQGGLSCDMHEFQITPNGTALLAMYDTVQADLSAIGSSASGWVMDCKFQEVDIETGDLLFEWSAADHFAMEETYRTIEHCSSDPFKVFDGCGYYHSSGFDFFHINSLQKDEQGNYLVSARNTHTVSYVDGQTGDVIWNLGGKRNSFEDLSGGAATNFSWQHHARWHGADTISLFDNAYHDWRDDPEPHSRAMIVNIDRSKMTASLQSQYQHPAHMRSASQGNAQVLPNGNMFVGWGRSAAFSEFAPDGQMLCDTHFGASAFYSFGPVSSYRVFREAWTGRPAEPPSVVLSGRTMFMSWNGATEVKTWQLQQLPVDDEDDEEDEVWKVVMQIAKTGFETEVVIPIDLEASQLRVVALDGNGKVLGKSESIAWGGEDFISWLKAPVVVLTIWGCAAATGLVAGFIAVLFWQRQRWLPRGLPRLRFWRHGPRGYHRLQNDEAEELRLGETGFSMGPPRSLPNR